MQKALILLLVEAGFGKKNKKGHAGNDKLRMWRNWQTRRLQEPVGLARGGSTPLIRIRPP